MFKNRLSYIVLMAGFASIAFAQLLWLLPALILEEDRLIGALEDHGRLVAMSVLQRSKFENVDWSDRATQRVLGLGKVIGGLVLNERGQSVRSFGKMPALGWIDVKQDGVSRELAVDRCCLDIHIGPKESGLANHLILRLDASQIGDQVWGFALNSLHAALFVSVVFGFGLSLIINRTLTSPLRQVRDAALSAVADPGKAHQRHLGFKRGDELGELAGAVDDALEIIAVAHKQGLTTEVPETALMTPIILEYDHSNTLQHANGAALSYFGAKSLEELASREERLFQRDQTPSPAKRALNSDSSADVSVLGQAYGHGRPARCLITTLPATTPSGTPNGRTVLLTPTEEAQASVDLTASEMVERRSAVIDDRRELAHTRQLLDCCMALKNQIVPQHGMNDTSAGIVSVRDLLKSWSKASIKEGLLRDDPRFGNVPDVYGSQDGVKTIFLSALAVICQRSDFTDPVINVRALVNDQRKACYVIEDVSAKQGRNDYRNPADTRSWELPYAAFADALARHEGLLIQADRAADDEDNNTISFGLPTPTKGVMKEQERQQLRASMGAA